jgi:TonB family protein
VAPFLKRATTLLVVFTALTVAAFAAERGVRRRVEPVYPELARRMHLSGSVKLEVAITSGGNVRNVNARGGNPLLVQAATDAIKKWQFEPGPEETKEITFEFKAQ